MKWFVAVEEGKYHYLEKKKKLRRRRTADLKARYEVRTLFMRIIVYIDIVLKPNNVIQADAARTCAKCYM